MNDTTKSAETDCGTIQDFSTADNTEDESDELFSGNDCVYAVAYV
jgi:hypothetical protein